MAKIDCLDACLFVFCWCVQSLRLVLSVFVCCSVVWFSGRLIWKPIMYHLTSTRLWSYYYLLTAEPPVLLVQHFVLCQDFAIC